VNADPPTNGPDPIAPPPRPRSTASSPGAWALLLTVAALGLAADLWSKSLAFQRVAGVPVEVRREDVLALAPANINRLIPAHHPVTVVPGALDFQLVLNPGAVFGVGAGRRWFFVVFTGLAIAFALWVFARWTSPRARAAHAGLGLIFAGGLGNLYDRLVHGCVRDFLHPLPGVPMPFGLSWPSGSKELWPWVSNVADAFLLIGVAMLMAALWRSPHPPRR
jgi:signal peptidase II